MHLSSVVKDLRGLNEGSDCPAAGAGRNSPGVTFRSEDLGDVDRLDYIQRGIILG